MTESAQAFNKLLDIATHARRTAKGLPSQVDIKPHWSGVGFIMFGRRFVAPIGEVTEMLEVPHYTQLPGVHGQRTRAVAAPDGSGHILRGAT